MNIQTFLCTMGLALSVCSSSLLYGQSLEQILSRLAESPRRENAIRAVESFRDQQARLKSKYIALAEAQGRVVYNSNDPLVAAPMIEELKQIKSWLSTDQDIPASDQFLPLVIGYASELAAARSKAYRAIRLLIGSLERNNSDFEAREVAKAFEQLGGIFQATETLQAGTVWHGHRLHGKSKTGPTLKLRVEKVSGDRFAGVIERDHIYGQHPVYRASGQIDGAMVKIQTLQNLRPGDQTDGNWTYHGYVLGRTIVGTFSGRRTDGKPGGGSFRLRH